MTDRYALVIFHFINDLTRVTICVILIVIIIWRCVVGDWCKFIVDTVNAGEGALCVTVDGPSKVHLECNQVKTGYQFAYCPAVPGLYLISIKYGGNTYIAGSPFRASIKGTIKLLFTANVSYGNKLYHNWYPVTKLIGTFSVYVKQLWGVLVECSQYLVHNPNVQCKFWSRHCFQHIIFLSIKITCIVSDHNVQI